VNPTDPVHDKWRPALWMVVFGVLIFVALIPLAGLLVIVGLEEVLDVRFKLRSIGGFAMLAIGSVVTAGVIGVIFLRTLLRPVQELIARTGEIEVGSQQAFRALDHTGTREGATLADRFFRMARKLSDRSNYLTLFATHVSHELKTPLTSIQGAAELLRDGGDDMDGEQRNRFLTNIVDDAARLSSLSIRLRELARADVAQVGGKCALADILREAASGADLGLETDISADLHIMMVQENGLIIFRQLAQNARQHDARILKARIEGDVLLIGDDGAPISRANRSQIFTPFFTTRREQGGTGMGLGIVSSMLRSYGGEIAASTRTGWKFEIKMPLG